MLTCVARWCCGCRRIWRMSIPITWRCRTASRRAGSVSLNWVLGLHMCLVVQIAGVESDSLDCGMGPVHQSHFSGAGSQGIYESIVISCEELTPVLPTYPLSKKDPNSCLVRCCHTSDDQNHIYRKILFPKCSNASQNSSCSWKNIVKLMMVPYIKRPPIMDITAAVGTMKAQ